MENIFKYVFRLCMNGVRAQQTSHPLADFVSALSSFDLSRPAPNGQAFGLSRGRLTHYKTINNVIASRASRNSDKDPRGRARISFFFFLLALFPLISKRKKMFSRARTLRKTARTEVSQRRADLSLR